MAKKVDNITINNARIIYRNFAGKEGEFNPAGKRSFSVVLDPELADVLARDGWNVKMRPGREEGDAPMYHLPVAVNYDGPFPPKIWIKTSDHKTLLDEETVNILDYAEIASVDLIVQPYCWELKSGKSGIKAYVKTMFVTIVEDELEKRYANIPDGSVDGGEGMPWN